VTEIEFRTFLLQGMSTHLTTLQHMVDMMKYTLFFIRTSKIRPQAVVVLIFLLSKTIFKAKNLNFVFLLKKACILAKCSYGLKESFCNQNLYSISKKLTNFLELQVLL